MQRRVSDLEIETYIKPKDSVFWVNEKPTKNGNKFIVYSATVMEISLCEYQGALYCTLYCPDFKINPYPNVHYSHVFKSKENAEDFAKELKHISKDNYPMCYGCKYAWKARGL